MQIDLGEERRVTGVTTQDGSWYGRYVTSFRVQTCATVDGDTCTAWAEVDNRTAFTGPTHGCRPPIGNCASQGKVGMRVPVEALFSTYVDTRMVRILPQSWAPADRPVMSAGVLLSSSRRL